MSAPTQEVEHRCSTCRNCRLTTVLGRMYEGICYAGSAPSFIVSRREPGPEPECEHWEPKA